MIAGICILTTTILGKIPLINSVLGEDFCSCFIILITTLGLLLDIYRSEVLRKYSAQILCGMLFRIFLLFWDIYCSDIFTLPGSGMDSVRFYKRAKDYVLNPNSDYAPFVKFIGRIMNVTGYTSRIYLQYIIVLFSIAAIIVFIKTLNGLSVSQTSRHRIVWIVCLIPNFACLSSILLRESLVIFFVTLSLLFILKWIIDTKILNIIAAFLLSFCAAYFHSGCVSIAVGICMIVLLYNTHDKTIKLSSKSICAAIALLVIFVFVYYNFGDAFFSKMAGTESISDISDGEAAGGSSYAQYVGNSASVFNMVIYTIPRIVYFLFSPLPWQWRGLSDIIAFFFSALFYFFVTLSVVKYFRDKRVDNKNIVILLCVLVISCLFVFSWGTINSGTALRHRDKLIFMFATLYSLTYDDSRIRIKYNGRRIF